jgi:prolyl-tRNA editing enzyme YbaK/EbsC (Cys-tRNA(Pro) deacylase)
MDRTPATARLSSRERVLAALAANGLANVTVKEFAESTATAVDAAAALGTTVERIVKSLVFDADGQPLLVLVSGPNRVDTHKLGQLVGAPIARANANQVREWTGFSIGGVPPVGHATPLQTYVDRSLLEYDEVWAAAGTPNAVFAIEPHELVRITAASVAEVAEAS